MLTVWKYDGNYDFANSPLTRTFTSRGLEHAKRWWTTPPPTRKCRQGFGEPPGDQVSHHLISFFVGVNQVAGD
ncbi:MAG: hypothetical protein NTY19_50315 [Planctomycetota bacterium]|nr:hypothetical protein [Planctomycetota bacterium]